MSLRIRRGTEGQRSSKTFDLGEILWTTDGQKLYVGDGVTPGAIDVAAQLAGQHMSYNTGTGKLDVSFSSLTTNVVPQGSNNLYFTTELAQDAVGAALIAGNSFNTGITFTYDDVNNRITADVSGGGGGSLPNQSGHSGNFLSTNGSAAYWAVLPNSINSVSADTTPALGGNLSLASHDITGSGNIGITGTITSSSNISNSVLTLAASAITSNSLSGGIRQVIIGDGPAGSPHQLLLTPISAYPPLLINSVASTLGGIPKITSTGYGGSVLTPIRLTAGQYITGFSTNAWEPTTSTALPVTGLFFKTDPNGVVNATNANGKIEFFTASGTNSLVQKAMTFDSKGQLAVNQQNAQATVDINGTMRLAILTAAPASPVAGMIAIADRVTWDPAAKVTGPSYPVYYNGSIWSSLV